MKAILVIDIPDYLRVDDVKIKYELFDKNDDKQIYGNYNLNELKPMPEKRISDGNDTEQIYGCYVGWNACIDEIIGEEKEQKMKLNKKKFYMMLQMCRNYWEKSDTDWLGLVINIGEDLEKETRVSWVVFVDIAHQMARLNVNDTKCQKIMELYGFELE